MYYWKKATRRRHTRYTIPRRQMRRCDLQFAPLINNGGLPKPVGAMLISGSISVRPIPSFLAAALKTYASLFLNALPAQVDKSCRRYSFLLTHTKPNLPEAVSPTLH